ncbi:MAG: stage II sporulation protein R [Clostridia bacterium]|nr:stage II sporulation protein R [Clostridia bacterium]
MMCLILTVIPHSSESVIDVTESTVRLRVVANSDSERDQNLKLAVRDGIIGKAHELFGDCSSLDEARLRIMQNSDEIKAEAKKILKANDCDMSVNVRLVREDVPVRRYSDFTFPAGLYETLRIDIGEADGKNWWCVMYPPLCLSAATGDVYAETAVFKEHGFTDEQIEELKQPKKKVRFALFEWLF